MREKESCLCQGCVVFSLSFWQHLSAVSVSYKHSIHFTDNTYQAVIMITMSSSCVGFSFSNIRLTVGLLELDMGRVTPWVSAGAHFVLVIANYCKTFSHSLGSAISSTDSVVLNEHQ